ncbi:WD40 domain-containing protein, partial [Cephalotus follicularis]
QKDQNKVCRYWVSGNCVKDSKCGFLHSWSSGDSLSVLAKLEGHEKAVTGIALPVGTGKLYSGSLDGTVRICDYHTGHCARVIDQYDKIGSLINEGRWVFVGMPSLVKALNIENSTEFSLEQPFGQVNDMVVANDMLFAGTQDGVILAWKGGSEANPFQLAASMNGHTGAVICLTVGSKLLYSGSMDRTIRVWDLETLHSIMTLHGHSDAVMSFLCWDKYLLSCSLDQTIKVWGATEEGNLEVTITPKEEHVLLALSGLNDAESKSILFLSCNDNSVRLYELPSFTEICRLFSKQKVREIQMGPPGGLFFTRGGTGMLTIGKWS